MGNINQLFDLPKNCKLLVVDDICDTGETIEWIEKQLILNELKYEIACIFTKMKHKNKIRFYGTVVPDDKWIVFPWE